MASSEQSDVMARRFLALKRPSAGGQKGSNESPSRQELATRLPRFAMHEWSVALLYLCLDVVSWVAIYGTVGWFRYDAYYSTPFQFFVIDLIQLAVIVAALYFVGGYDRAVEKR